MQESKLIRPEHTILIPYGAGVFGRIRPMILDVRFDVELYEDGRRSLKILSLTGKEPSGKVYDMIYLVDDGDGEGIASDLMNGIIGNEQVWDETYQWWCESKPK